jgi:hypothetical protein
MVIIFRWVKREEGICQNHPAFSILFNAHGFMMDFVWIVVTNELICLLKMAFCFHPLCYFPRLKLFSNALGTHVGFYNHFACKSGLNMLQKLLLGFLQILLLFLLICLKFYVFTFAMPISPLFIVPYDMCILNMVWIIHVNDPIGGNCHVVRKTSNNFLKTTLEAIKTHK